MNGLSGKRQPNRFTRKLLIGYAEAFDLIGSGLEHVRVPLVRERQLAFERKLFRDANRMRVIAKVPTKTRHIVHGKSGRLMVEVVE